MSLYLNIVGNILDNISTQVNRIRNVVPIVFWHFMNNCWTVYFLNPLCVWWYYVKGESKIILSATTLLHGTVLTLHHRLPYKYWAVSCSVWRRCFIHSATMFYCIQQLYCLPQWSAGLLKPSSAMFSRKHVFRWEHYSAVPLRLNYVCDICPHWRLTSACDCDSVCCLCICVWSEWR